VVIVNAGLKSESVIDANEFKNDMGEIEVKVGDFVSVASKPWKTATARPNCRAKKPSAWLPGTSWTRQ